VIPSINEKYRPYADQVVNLFKDRKIEKTKEAEKLLFQLASRGNGPKSAIAKITEKYNKAESAKGKLTRPTTQTFFVSGTTQSTITYEQKLKKAGIIKARSYDIETPFAVSIKAKNKADAEQKAQAWSASTWINGEGADSYAGKSKKFKGAKVSSITPVSSFTATDNKAVTGFMVAELATAPLAGDAGWSAGAPVSYSFDTEGTKTLYAWVKDAAGNVSTSLSDQVVITLPDVTNPEVTDFSIPESSIFLAVSSSIC
jgi:hypothetical protein